MKTGLYLVVLLILTAALPAQDRMDARGRQLLEQSAAAYRKLTSYRDQLVQRHVLYVDGQRLVVSVETASVALMLPSYLLAVPGQESLYCAVSADGETITLLGPGQERGATFPQEEDLLTQLKGVEEARLTWWCIPAVLFLHPQPLGTLEESYGPVRYEGRRSLGPGAGEVDVLRLSLGGDRRVRLYLHPDTHLLTGARLSEPAEVVEGRRIRRYLELEFRNPERNPALTPDDFQIPGAGEAHLSTLEELRAALLEETSYAGRPLPEFTVPPVRAGGSDFNGQRLGHHPWLITFLLTWDQASFGHLRTVSQLAAQLDDPRRPRVAAIAMDDSERVAQAEARLSALAGVEGFLDPGGAVARSLGLLGSPNTFLVGEGGTVLLEIRGTPEESRLRQQLREALGISREGD